MYVFINTKWSAAALLGNEHLIVFKSETSIQRPYTEKKIWKMWWGRQIYLKCSLSNKSYSILFFIFLSMWWVEELAQSHHICCKDLKIVIVVWMISCWFLITAVLFSVPLAFSASTEHIPSQIISLLWEQPFFLVPIMIIALLSAPHD